MIESSIRYPMINILTLVKSYGQRSEHKTKRNCCNGYSNFSLMLEDDTLESELNRELSTVNEYIAQNNLVNDTIDQFREIVLQVNLKNLFSNLKKL